MIHKIKYMVLTALILSFLPSIAMAQLTKDIEDKITDLCTHAIEKKGYIGYTYKYVEVARAHSQNYGMLGQLHKGKKHFEFNCFLNTDSKNLKIEELVVNSLDNK